jgi:hypothetical protein
MINKLAVFGCSYSDYLPLNRVVYGEALADLLAVEYLHYGVGAGSNWRIWRSLAQSVISGEIDRDSVVLIQYTGLERREFWSSKPPGPHRDRSLQTRDIASGGGSLLRYKAMAWTWQDHRIENQFFRLYEEYFVNTDYERSWFDIQHLQCQLLLREYGIRAIFMDCRHTPIRPLALITPYDQWQWQEPCWLQETDQYDYEAGEDNSHFNDHGHRTVAGLLKQHILDQGW